MMDRIAHKRVVSSGLVLLGCLCMAMLGGCQTTPSTAGADSGEAAQPSDPTVVRVPTSEEVMYRVFAAEYLGAEGDLEGAVGEYLVAAMESSDPEIARRATRVAFAAESWQEAVMAADRWALLDPGSIAAHEAAATAMLQVGDYLGAEYQIIQILDLMEDSAEAWLLVSNLLSQSGDPKQADLVLQQIQRDRPAVDGADVYYARSQLAVKGRDLGRAYELAREAVRMQPDNAKFLTWAGRLALNQDRREEGLGFIRRAYELDREDHDLALAYADLLARSGDADGARRVMSDMTQTPDVLLSRILFELAANEREAADRLFAEFEASRFDDPVEQAFYLAQAAEALGRYAVAIDYYGRVDSGDRALAAAIRRAELTAIEGDVASARAQLAELRLQGNEVTIEESWLAEARMLREIGDREQAFRVLEVAVGQSPDSIPILYTHALLAAELGWVDIAETGLRKILAAQPENASALNALGYTLADQTERFEEAEALIRQAFILQPHEPSIIDSMGWVAYRLGRNEEAIEYLERAWNLDRNAEIAAHLGEVLWVNGEEERAREIWQEGMAVDDANPIMLETLERLGVEL
jgi:Flp pilus assembly protein TadD